MNKILEWREAQAWDAIRRDVADGLADRILDREGTPGWIWEAVDDFWDMTKEPQATLTDEASPAALGQWIEKMLSRCGFHEEAFIFTHLSTRPWIACKIAQPGWFTRIRLVIDDAWVFVSDDLSVVAAAAEQEYRYEFFCATSKSHQSRGRAIAPDLLS
ncbi:hypothetical protein ACF06Q_29210 [Streptomyces leeuwenhoekii]|uniref:hypothetical protein n=1 Tax=Streptomyces leeuwenhoekii TaxID=1437453 RepID=UPI003701F729